MAETIIDGTNIDTSLFAYSAPKAHEAGGKVVNLWNKRFKSSLTISTPLILTWGAQESLDVNKNPFNINNCNIFDINILNPVLLYNSS
jgi:hypothetical protein